MVNLTLPVRVLSCLVLTLAAGATSHAGDAPPTRHPDRLNLAESRGPLCGIWSLYAAAHGLDQDVEIDALVRPEYCQSLEGSSVSELQNAASAIGLKTLAFTDLNLAAVRDSDWPLILHVRGSPWSRAFNHYLLVAEHRDGNVLIFDGTKPGQWLPLADLAPIWGGTGIAVGLPEAPPVQAGLFAPSYMSFALAALPILAGALGFRAWRSRRMPYSRNHRGGVVTRMTVQVFAVLVVGAGLALAYHASATAGFLRAGSAVRYVEEWHTAHFLDVIDYDEVTELMQRDDVHLVDARDQPMFDDGHIPGSKLLLWERVHEEHSRVMAPEAMRETVIIYCSGPSCGNADVAAQALKSEGYRDVRVYRGGWSEWRRRQQLGGGSR